MKASSIYFLIAGFFSFTGAAAATEAEIAGDGSAVSWPAEAGHLLVLSVSGPEGFHHREEFAAGSEPRFEIFSDAGDYRADGGYSWELTGIPVTKARRPRELDARAFAGKADPTTAGIRASGHVSIAGGSFVDPDLTETASAAAGRDGVPAKDFILSDDMIVDGRLCAGVSCVNNEPFGDETFKLKEINTRIKFEDTSGGSFPTNDWQLTANAKTSGGLNKFSIDDLDGGTTPFTVEAGAPTDALYVDDDGDVGIGTSVPVYELHVKDGDSPTLRLEQDGSIGFDPQTWDVVGNEYSFFIRDSTNGSTLPFRIVPGAATGRLVISGDNVGIGSVYETPAARLHVENTSYNDHDDVAVTDLGRIGIGTTTPAQAIHIATAVQNTGRIRFDDGDVWDLGSGNSSNFIIDTGAGTPEVLINASGTMVLSGALITGGGGACDPGPCDGTFTDYELESIEEHAAYMWQNSHLWGVGPTPEGAPMNLTKKTAGILHELEKAHIYIEQLNDRAKAKDSRITELERRLARLEQALSPEVD